MNWHQISTCDREGVSHIILNSELMGDTFMRLQGKMARRHIFEADIEYATRSMDAVMIAVSARGYLGDVAHDTNPLWLLKQ